LVVRINNQIDVMRILIHQHHTDGNAMQLVRRLTPEMQRRQ
jgi:hypothetical protein